MTTAGRARALASFAGFCLLVAACITAFSALAFSRWSGRAMLLGAVANLVLSFAIGGMCWLMLPGVFRQTWQWHPFNRWSALLLTMVVAAAAGTAIGVVVARLSGIGAPMADIFVNTFRTSLPITLVAGVVVTLLESSKSRLARAELAVRTQQVERERAEKLAAEARLASLASRVQPHFLFNTLNSIAALIRDDPRAAEETLERLSSLLRGSLDSAASIPVEQEMRLVSDYLEIQRTRLGDRLRHRIDWDPDSRNGVTVPPFSVQSLVENAIKHVAGQRQEGVELQIAVRVEPVDLVIEVADDGPGFDLEAIKGGHGLDNLQGRLRSLYGERAGLEFDRTPSRMIVRLRIPTA